MSSRPQTPGSPHAMPYFARGIPMLPVADVRQAIDFYVDKLDFRMDFNAGAYGGVRRDAIEVHFWRVDAAAHAPKGSCRIEVTEIRKLYSAYRDRGIIPPSGDTQATPWGTTEFVVTDPDGNSVTFVEVFGLGS